MIFALERLEALRAGRPLDDILDITGPEGLSKDWRIEYEERAAILEYDGGLVREEAEALALQEIRVRTREYDQKNRGGGRG